MTQTDTSIRRLAQNLWTLIIGWRNECEELSPEIIESALTTLAQQIREDYSNRLATLTIERFGPDGGEWYFKRDAVEAIFHEAAIRARQEKP